MLICPVPQEALAVAEKPVGVAGVETLTDALQAFEAVFVLPLLRPLQPQVHGPLPEKLATVVPFAQRFAESALREPEGND